MPDLMLRYRAASWLVRSVAPELSMGLQTVEEVQDMPVERNITPAESSVDALNAALSAPRQDKPNRTTEAQEAPSEAPVAAEKVIEPEAEPEPAPQPPAAWPREIDGVLQDSQGTPFNVKFHSASRACTADGTWRMRRGHNPAEYKRWLAELDNPPEPTPAPEPETVEPPATTSGLKFDQEWFNRMINSAKSADDLDEVAAVFETSRSDLDEESASIIVGKFQRRQAELTGQ